MILDNFKSFPKSGKLLGIDWGARRIGLAISDPERKFVFLRPENSDILKMAADEDVVGIVLGLPLYLDGTESETTKRVRAFALELAGKTDLPIVLFDESLTSFEASGARPKNLDSESARVLLENAIAVMSRHP